ncbi:MAG: hypothetical protein OXQ29_04445 [Rhodospirillaceae bacterium]|nr:hypothetical protein [Rhodospirillaceae bacterium]
MWEGRTSSRSLATLEHREPGAQVIDRVLVDVDADDHLDERIVARCCSNMSPASFTAGDAVWSGGRTEL